jgi:uncharacterized membrane protein
MNANEKIREEKRKKREELRTAICNTLAFISGVLFILGFISAIIFGYISITAYFCASAAVFAFIAAFFTAAPSGGLPSEVNRALGNFW